MIATAPKFKSTWEQDIQAEMLELMKAVAAKWILRASLIPQVSGQARGTFRPFAKTVKTPLGRAIKSTARKQPARKTPGQSRATGEAAQIHGITGKEIFFEVTLSRNYMLLWQDQWGEPLDRAGEEIQFNFELELAGRETAFAPINFLESVELR